MHVANETRDTFPNYIAGSLKGLDFVPGPLELPAGGAETFFLHDIAALTEAQQITLYDWLNTRGRQAQVVSMTGSQILPLVESGRFHEGLFYRLNTITSVAGSV